MKRLLLALGVLALFAAPAAAQTHPCDITPAVVDVQPNVVFGVGFCLDLKDGAGNPVSIDTIKVSLDGTQVFNAPLQPIGAPNAAGLSYFETPKTFKVTTNGQHTVTVIAASLLGGDSAATPLSFAAKALPPNPATKPRIAK